MNVVTEKHTEAIRSFYDPFRTLPDRSVLFDSILTERLREPTDENSSNIAHDLTAELLFTGMHIDDLSHTEAAPSLDRAADEVESTISAQTNLVVDMASDVREQYPRLQYSDIALTGLCVAAFAHRGVYRKNGRPYLAHPIEVASTIGAASRMVAAYSDKDMQRLFYESFVHDGLEDSLPKVRMSFIRNERFFASPLLTKRLLGKLGVENASSAATTELLLSKPWSYDGKNVSYPMYIARGQQDHDFLAIKPADIHHNHRLDPKPLFDSDLKFSTRVHAKHEMYDEMLTQLYQSAENNIDDIHKVIALHSLQGITPLSIKEYQKDMGVPGAQQLVAIATSHYESRSLRPWSLVDHNQS